MSAKTLSIIIPAYNEAKNIPLVVPEVIDYCMENNYELIIVNDGSTDNSRELLNEFNKTDCLTLIHHKINNGYGGAIKTGISACKTDYLVTMDCDGQHRVENVTGLYDQLLLNEADMIVGSRKGLDQAACHDQQEKK